MSGLSAVRQTLMDLASLFPPTVRALLDPDSDVRVVVSDSRSTVLVELIATVTTAVPRTYYRNAETHVLYGSLSEPGATVEAILQEIGWSKQ